MSEFALNELGWILALNLPKFALNLHGFASICLSLPNLALNLPKFALNMHEFA